MKRVLVFSSFMFFVFNANVVAANNDINGAKDSPLVSRYPGSTISHYAMTEYEDYKVPTGALKNKKLPTIDVAGRYTTIGYRLPENVSTLQVMRNYEEAFKKAKVKQLLSCNQSNCGYLMPKAFVLAQGESKTSRYLSVDVYNANERSDYRFWSGKLESKGKDIYFVFMVMKSSSKVSAFVDILEQAPMQSGLVAVHPNALQKTVAAKFEKHKDVAGAKDHPLISRYPGAYISQYSRTAHEQYKFPTGRLDKNKLPLESVQGTYTTIVYKLPKSLSTLQVLKNYQQAFKKANVKEILSCDQTNCGGLLPKIYVQSQVGGTANQARYLGVDVYNANDRSDYRFWSGILGHAGKKVYITFMVMKNTVSVSAFVDVLEAGKMESGLVSLDLSGLSDAIDNEGKAVLSGIYFDNDKATLKQSSTPSMKIIAQYLTNHPKKNVFIVGHTDNQGSYSHNIKLSQQRADTVVEALVKQYKIAKNRLTAVGVGPVSPVTNNLHDFSRQNNRRVEMVLK